jgi:hypothetical protein
VKKTYIWIVVLATVIACTNRPTDPPTIELESPSDGLEVVEGERVLVQSTARHERGVIKTELWVDGRLYEVNHADRGGGDLEFDSIQIWNATTLGTHTLSVRAYSSDGRVSLETTVQVVVVPTKPTPTPAPEATATPAAVEDCEPSARFVEDVTVPDDSLFNSGVNFRKTWRLRNDGECTWPAGTQWVFIAGDLLGAQSPVEVELAEPERIVDISVDMVAPAAPGTYNSYWRLQTTEGEFFGDQAYVRIIVP